MDFYSPKYLERLSEKGCEQRSNGEFGRHPEDVFLRDLQEGTTERVSVDSSGAQTEENGHSANPSISSDGRFIAFASIASNLVLGDANNDFDVFVHERDTTAP